MKKNLETIRKVYEAMAAKDGEAIRELSDPTIEVRQSEELPWGGTYRGLEEAMNFFHMVSGYLDSKVTVDRLMDAGDQFVVIGKTEGTVRETGRAFSVPLVHLWGLRDGRVAALVVLLDNPVMNAALKGAA